MYIKNTCVHRNLNVTGKSIYYLYQTVCFIIAKLIHGIPRNKDIPTCIHSLSVCRYRTAGTIGIGIKTRLEVLCQHRPVLFHSLHALSSAVHRTDRNCLIPWKRYPGQV